MASHHESAPDDLALALAAVGVMIRHIEPNQWASPTPCTEWPVRRVVGHLGGMNRVFCALLAGEPMPDRSEIADTDLAQQYEASGDALVALFRAQGALEREFVGPLGSSTGYERLQIRLYDLLAHGWDVARATGQRLNLADDLCARSLAFATRQLDGVDRAGRFEPPQSCPDEATALDRLAAFLGRDVSWPAGDAVPQG
jgi:uncharacterized protein (TIGR03086 family)